MRPCSTRILRMRRTRRSRRASRRRSGAASPSSSAFRPAPFARDNACIHHVDQLVLREMDRVGYRIARFLEANGRWAFQTAAQETVWEMKNASYGSLSTRHVAIEAGLGTIGLELNLLTKEAGPRCYTTVVL